jgi:WD40 repeat protein
MEEFDIKNKILKECIKCNNIPLYGLIPENNDLKIFSKCNCGKKIIRNNYHEQMFKKYNKELNKLKENQKCLIHNKEIYSLDFTKGNDTKYLISGDGLGDCRLWNIKNGECVQIIESGEETEIIASSFNERNSDILIADVDNIVRLFTNEIPVNY